MTAFERFKELFDDHYGSSIYAFINNEENYYDLAECPFEYELQDNLDNVYHDSYGNEDSDLRRIYYIKDFNIYVEFTGNRSSYNGEEWYGFKEVNKTTKTISIWE